MNEDVVGQWSQVVIMPGISKDDDPSTPDDEREEGVWPIHAVLTKTGDILFFSGRLEGAGYLYQAWVWTPPSTNLPPPVGDPPMDAAATAAVRSAIPAPFDNSDPNEPEAWFNPDGTTASAYAPGLDLFCCHHTHLEDGRILVMGGASGRDPGDAAGSPGVFIFDPDAPPATPFRQYWTRLPFEPASASRQMADGRWYPTSVMLGDGRIVVFSGRRTTGWVNEDVEVFAPPDYEAELVQGGDRKLHIYPSMHLTRGGRIFYTNACWAYRNEQPSAPTSNPALLDGTGLPTAAFVMNGPTDGAWVDFADPANPAAPLEPIFPERQEATAVLLPPAHQGKILLLGGARPRFTQEEDPTGNLMFQYRDATDSEIHIAVDAAWNVVDPPGGALTPAPDNHRWIYTDGTGTVVSDSVSRRMLYDGFTPASLSTAAEILHTRGRPGSVSGVPEWEDVGPMLHGRVNVNAVILPDGKVLVIGGDEQHRNINSPFVAECEIFDPALAGSPGAFTEAAPLEIGRNYHSTTVLLPDGRVYAGGGRTGASGHNMQLYKPPYFFTHPEVDRLAISAILVPDSPASHVRYGNLFDIHLESLGDIRRVTLTRLGSITHHTDSDQRHLDLTFTLGSHHGVQVITAQAPTDASVTPPGHYLVWVLDQLDRPCKKAAILRLSHRGCEIVLNRSTFGRDETQSRLDEANPAIIEEAVYVYVDGFTPQELGIGSTLPTGNAIDTLAPSMTLGPGSNGMSIVPRRIIPERQDLDPRIRQRFTFAYDIRFTSVAAFPDASAGDDRNDVAVQFNVEGHQCRRDLRLIDQPNPYMTDGPTHWLSVDLRVFRVKDSQPTLGDMVSGDPLGYIQRVSDDFAARAGDFDDLPTDQMNAALTIRETEDGEPVWNFAIAQVRYRGSAGIDAADVRCFFRMFQTARTNMSFDPTSNYRSFPPAGPAERPLLGVNGSEVVTIPFFDRPRSGDMSTQETTTRTFPGTGGDVTRYFGAWLDINQRNDPRFPRSIDANDHGPYTATPGNPLLPIQDLIAMGEHQCLVAEIVFGDLIETGDAPGSSDKLSQRNIAYLPADNPGSATSRVVQHTFDIEPQTPSHWVKTNLAAATGTAPAELSHHRLVATTQWKPTRVRYDELLVFWGNLPRDTEVEMFIPNADVDTMVELHRLRHGPASIAKVDASRIRVRVDSATHIPFVAHDPINSAGLITIALPEGITDGEDFRAVVHHVDGLTRSIVGAFELFIPVRPKESFLMTLVGNYAVLKKAAATVPPANRWFPVVSAYLDGLEARIRGLGVEPNRIPADGGGFDPSTGGSDPGAEGAGAAAGVGVGAIAGGLVPGAVGWIVGLIGILVLWWWIYRRRPTTCALLNVLVAGTAAAAGVLAVVAALSQNPSPQMLIVLAVLVIATALLLLLAHHARCCWGEWFRSGSLDPGVVDRAPGLAPADTPWAHERAAAADRSAWLAAKKTARQALPTAQPAPFAEHHHDDHG